ncbi:MAG: hypothetical protein R3B82_21880 [Sandaracinaceae bacterium]
MRAALLLLFASTCGSVDRTPACTDGIWGEPAYDALDALNDPALLEADEATLRDAARRLRRAGDRDPRLEPPARVALQNDVWGVWQRARAQPVSSSAHHAVEAAAARLVRRLAPPRVPPWEVGLPPPVAAALGPGWHEEESELPSLQHERLFGLRRVFHVARQGTDRRALFSTLVAIDAEGQPRITPWVGDLEILRFSGGRLVEARVHELDRRTLRCHGPDRALRSVREVRHVPGTGAHGFLLEADPPASLDDLPCARCHEDDGLMSLPTPELTVGRRFQELLAPARAEGRTIALEGS